MLAFGVGGTRAAPARAAAIAATNTDATAVMGLTLPGAAHLASIDPPLRQRLTALPPGSTVTAWVFLRDKGDINVPPTPFALVSERSLRRRLKVRTPEQAVDVDDVPLASAYVAAIAAHVHRVRQRSKWLNAVSVEATGGEIESLRRLPCVRAVACLATAARRPAPAREAANAKAAEPPVTGSTPLRYDYGSSLNQLQQIRVVDLHAMGLTGKDILIGHFDTGYRLLTHESLTGLNVHAAWDFVANEPDPDQAPCPPGQVCNSHGLETLSVLAGFKEGRLIGPAFGATYLLARTESEAVESPLEEDLWVAAMEWADSIGVDVVSSSVGYRTFDAPYTSYTWEDMDGDTAVITRAADMAAARGIVVVAAIGNDGLVQDFNTIYAPADGDSVLAVGAVDRNGVHSALSSYGPTADGRTKPDVLAEGIGTMEAIATNTGAYGAGSGTSSACPLVAGAAALLLEAFPDASPMQIVDALRRTASRATTPDRYEGWGIIDALAAYRTLRDQGPEPPPFGGRSARIVPNPYPLTPVTPIRIDLPEPAHVTLQLFDIRGRLVRDLLSETLPAASHTIPWNGLDDDGHQVASGAYILRLQTEDVRAPGHVEQATRKVILLR